MSDVHCNLALCHIKLEQWVDAVHSADACLVFDKGNVKALYRKAIACERLQHFSLAHNCVRNALHFWSDSKHGCRSAALQLESRVHEKLLVDTGPHDCVQLPNSGERQICYLDGFQTLEGWTLDRCAAQSKDLQDIATLHSHDPMHRYTCTPEHADPIMQAY